MYPKSDFTSFIVVVEFVQCAATGVTGLVYKLEVAPKEKLKKGRLLRHPSRGENLRSRTYGSHFVIETNPEFC